MDLDFKVRFSGNGESDRAFSVYELDNLVAVYNKTIVSLQEVIIPYISDRTERRALNRILNNYNSISLLVQLNKLITGLALIRSHASYGNKLKSLMDEYEMFFNETKAKLGAMRYDFAFATILAFDKLNYEYGQFIRSARATRESRGKLNEIKAFLDAVKTTMGSNLELLNGAVTPVDAGKIANKMHVGDIYINIRSLAANIVKLKDAQEYHKNGVRIATRRAKHTQNENATLRVMNDIYDLTRENAELRMQLNAATARANKIAADNALLERVFDSNADARIAELERQVRELTTENAQLRSRGVFSLFRHTR
ncbi:MAG: hypothetical protein IJ560_01155 [Alphaproteobacteria bacterium]|nr:hypothetical protein [Alphaproteobacteria bacterium]